MMWFLYLECGRFWSLNQKSGALPTTLQSLGLNTHLCSSQHCATSEISAQLLSFPAAFFAEPPRLALPMYSLAAGSERNFHRVSFCSFSEVPPLCNSVRKVAAAFAALHSDLCLFDPVRVPLSGYYYPELWLGKCPQGKS